ncbi:MAG TPA: lamin tail domain-containing protein, partial [Candidatus Saccharimonadales bacterium]|nr:lamin tail domain-containing protein [Candidatus Saccharimonadales bacterium]
ALGLSPFQYQWESNGLVLSGDTNSSVVMTNLTLAASGNYNVIISDSLGAVTSAPVALSVMLDPNPPVVLRAFNIGTTNVEVDFSKTIGAAGATNLANYAFTNGVAISVASLTPDNSSVLLTTAPLVFGSNYTLVINGILDQAIPPNTIATNTLFSFTASPYTAQDIGGPVIASTDTSTTNGVTIASAGSNIGGASDQFNLDYQLQTGDFDVTVCLAGLGLSDLWAEAGLMARVSLDAGSPFAATLATPGMNGEFFADRTTTNGLAVTAGTFPVNYPHTWLRLNRIGNVFTGFGSYDGTNWTQLGTATIAMPAQIYLGLAVASHNSNQLTTAQFVNYETTPTNAVVATIVNPHDANGPTSRTTPMAFSEIMWKPAPRTDGKNLEFLEIYNSNPWFQDISGYQITCADMNYTFPPNTQIPGGGYLVVAAAPADIESVYGITNVMGPYNGSLKHSETLEMLDEQTNVLLTLPYTDVYPWPVATDGTGHSLVQAYPTYGEGDPRAWDISDVVGGSPGQMDGFTPSPLRNVVINEILPHSENSAVPQFIELYNHSTNSVDVSGCILTDDPATNKFVIPSGTVIGPAGFVSFTQPQFGFTLNGEGETLYFIKPDNSRVLDAVQFGAQADGVSYGRWPDGANDFYAFTTNTPGTNNSAIVIGDVVINELMYDPISGNNDDQYIELYNKGTNTINLSGWEFTSGVTFTFPTNAVIRPNGYVVIGKDTNELFSNYPNLNAANTYGNYSSHLSHDGALVVLAQPETYYGTNTIYVEEDQVTYGTGGRWGEWSSGGGSSLELIDPHSNHRLAANWADSDETQKSSWVQIQNTGVLDNGANYDPSIDYAQIGLLDAGECLVDNIEVNYNGSNYVSNGTFEGGLGLTDWSIQGCMACSSLESTGYQSSYSLHIRSSDRLWTGDNSCEVALNPNSMGAGDTVTMSYMARWLRGTPEPDFR